MNKNKGFTLIELLIVMAILGVLAVVVLVAINPVQQLARTRDAGRKSGIAQIGRAMEAYYTVHSGSYVLPAAGWVTTLANAGEISTVPSTIDPGVAGYVACTSNVENGWCIDGDYNAVVIYTVLESDSEASKCGGNVPVFAWATTLGRGGLYCAAGADITVSDLLNSTDFTD